MDALQERGIATSSATAAGRQAPQTAPHSPFITLPAPGQGSIPGAAIRIETSKGGASQQQAASFSLPHAAAASEELKSDTRYLRVHVVQGMAFMEHILEEQGSTRGQGVGGSSTADHVPGPSNVYYVLSAYHMGQRFASPLVPASTEPAFNFTFHVDMSSVHPEHGSLPSPAALLTVKEPMRLVLTMVTINPGRGTGSLAVPDAAVTLVSSLDVEWRGVLCQGKAALTVELPPLGAAAGLTELPVGVLDLRMELVPPTGPPKADTESSGLEVSGSGRAADAAGRRLALGVPSAALRKRLADQAAAADEAGRRFFAYARKWWGEYCACGVDFK